MKLIWKKDIVCGGSRALLVKLTAEGKKRRGSNYTPRLYSSFLVTLIGPQLYCVEMNLCLCLMSYSGSAPTVRDQYKSKKIGLVHDSDFCAPKHIQIRSKWYLETALNCSSPNKVDQMWVVALETCCCFYCAICKLGAELLYRMAGSAVALYWSVIW